MTLSDAQKWLDKQTGDPTDGYITPDDVKQSFAQTYADMPNLAPVTLQVTGLDGKVTTLQGTVTGLSAATQHSAPVANAAALPATGNTDGDVRVTLDDHHLHVWVAGSSSWTDIGPVTSPHTYTCAPCSMRSRMLSRSAQSRCWT